jgi:hypothetical protein
MENLEDILKGYLEKKSRIMVLEIKILKAKEELEIANTPYIEDEKDAIAGMQMSAVTINPDKPGPTNKFSSTVENTTIHYKDEIKIGNEFETQAIKRDIKIWEKEIYELKAETAIIDAALKSLTKEEEFIVHCFYFEKMYWRNITDIYKVNFPTFKDERTLKRVKESALEKLNRVVA